MIDYPVDDLACRRRPTLAARVSPVLAVTACTFAAASSCAFADAPVVASGWRPDPGQLLPALGFALLLIGALLAGLFWRTRQLAAARRRLLIAASGYDSVLEYLPDPVWLKDVDGVYLVGNPALEALFGEPHLRIIGRTDFDFMATPEAREARRLDREAIESGKPLESEEWVTFGDDGYSALLQTTRIPVYDDEGRLAGVLGIGRDITQQRRVEEELRRRENYQRALLDNFPFLVWLKDTDSRYLAVNRRFAETAGEREPAEIVGRTDHDIWPVDLANAYRAADRQVMATRSASEVREEIADGGHRRLMETYKAPVLDQQGRLLGTVGFARDVSERAAIELALRNSEARFRAFFERNASVMLLVEPVSQTIIAANAAASAFYGYSGAELTGMPLHRINTLPAPGISDAIGRALRQEGDAFAFRHRLADGELRDVEVRSTPIESGGRTLLFSIIHDVTERRRAEAALAAERDLFSSGPVVVFTWAPEPGWPVRQVSSNVVPVLGYTREQVCDRAFRFSDIIHLDDVERVGAEVGRYLDARTDRFEQSYRVRRGDGDYVWFHDFTQIERDDQGAVAAIRGYLFDQSELKTLELSLADERNRLAYVLEGTHVGTWEWNVQSGETRFNERWAEIIGYRLDEIAPVSIETWMAYVHPDDAARSAEALRRHFDGESDYYDCEARMRHRDGHWVWVHDRGRVFEWTADGAPLWMYGTHQDITERKRAEQALRDSERRLRIAGDIAYDLVYEWTPASGALRWFGSVERVLGYTDDEGPRDTERWLALVHPEDAPAMRAAIQRNATSAQPCSCEYRIRHKAGHYRHWIDKAVPLCDEDGCPHTWVGVCTDVSEQRQADENLRLAAAVFEHAQEGIMITDADAVIVDVNTAFTVITGYSRDEVIGRNPRMLASGRHDAGFYSTMWQALTRRGHWHGEIWNRARNGAVYAELLSISAVRSKGGEPQRYVGLFSDITTFKQQQTELEHLAYFDPLTGLPNRALLRDRLEQAIAQASRRQNHLAVSTSTSTVSRGSTTASATPSATRS